MFVLVLVLGCGAPADDPKAPETSEAVLVTITSPMSPTGTEPVRDGHRPVLADPGGPAAGPTGDTARVDTGAVAVDSAAAPVDSAASPVDTATAPIDSAPPPPEPAEPPADTGEPVPVEEEPPPEPPADTGEPVLEEEEPPPPPVVARLEVDDDDGDFPLVVSFDATGSDLGSGQVRYEWSFGDGAEVDGDAEVVHTYVGEGKFEATVTLVDEVTGEESVAEVDIDVDTPKCPKEDPAVAWGLVDSSLTAISGIVASRTDDEAYWIHEDHDDTLTAVDADGVTLSEQDLPGVVDLEDVAAAVDPDTGEALLFVGDIGDNDLVRASIEVWVVEEPDPTDDGDLDPLRMELTYPDFPRDAESLFVDPLTLDVFVLTKGGGELFAKRAPHDDEGPFELEALGTFEELDFTATGADVSADGAWIVVRDYGTTARIWPRDGYEPLEEAFEEEPCEVEVFLEEQGEGVAFTVDGSGLVTVGEGELQSLHHVPL